MLCSGLGMQGACHLGVAWQSHGTAAGTQQRTSSWLSTRSSLSSGLLAMCRLTACSTLETGTPLKRAPALTQDPAFGIWWTLIPSMFVVARATDAHQQGR